MSSTVVLSGVHGLSLASAVRSLKVCLLVSQLLNHLIFHPLQQNPVADKILSVNHLLTFLRGCTSLFSIFHHSHLSHILILLVLSFLPLSLSLSPDVSPPLPPVSSNLISLSALSPHFVFLLPLLIHFLLSSSLTFSLIVTFLSFITVNPQTEQFQTFNCCFLVQYFLHLPPSCVLYILWRNFMISSFLL